MNKQMRELLEQINAKKAEAHDYLAKANAATEKEEKENFKAKARTATDEMKALQEDFNLAKDLFEADKNENTPKEPQPAAKDYEKEFLNGVRSKFKNAMSEGSDPDGGYTVPVDIKTDIINLRESKDALSRYITVEPVSTLSGSRVFKARSQQTGFVEVSENGTMSGKATPQFTPLSYNVKKYAGFFKVTNELLKDSDQAIRQTLVNWIGDESRVTRNKLILTALGTKAKTAIAGIDDIKKSMNVTLDPAFHNTSIILTNQDGFNYLDTLKDNNGQYLLQPSVTAPTGKKLGNADIVMVSNKDLPNDTTTTPGSTLVPIIMGDLKEAVVLFDRETLSIDVSNVAMDAFETDVTYFRAIEREEVKTRDAEAFVYGQITLV